MVAGTMKFPQPEIHPADATLMYINSNPYFIGLMMLTLNLGGRFISLELSKSQEAFFQNPWVRRFLIFTVLFVGTRNIAVAFWMTFIVVLVLGHLLNENSALCIYTGSSTCRSSEGMTAGPQHTGTPPPVPGMPPTPSMPGLSHEESSILQTLQTKVARASQALQGQASKSEKKSDESSSNQPSFAQTYLQNMLMLRSEGFANPRF